jgi:uncharacterized damage-inducible protein DinB
MGISERRGALVTETPQEYTARILGLAAGHDHLKVQAATPTKLRRLLKGQPARALTRPPAPGKWSVRQIVAHLADAEVVVAYRMRTILSRSGTAIQAFDQNEWAADGRYDQADTEEALAAFVALRRLNLRLLKRLAPAERARYGMHQERGKENLDRIATMVAGHDLNHLGQIEGILRRSGRSGPKS